MLLEFLNFTGGRSPGKNQTKDCCLVSGSYLYTKVSSSVTIARLALTCLFEACEGSTPSYPSSVPRSAGGAPYRRNASILSGYDIGSDFSYSWVFFDQSLHLGHVLFRGNGHRLATTVTIFKRRFAELQFLILLVKCRSRWKEWSLKQFNRL